MSNQEQNQGGRVGYTSQPYATAEPQIVHSDPDMLQEFRDQCVDYEWTEVAGRIIKEIKSYKYRDIYFFTTRLTHINRLAHLDRGQARSKYSRAKLEAMKMKAVYKSTGNTEAIRLLSDLLDAVHTSIFGFAEEGTGGKLTARVAGSTREMIYREPQQNKGWWRR